MYIVWFVEILLKDWLTPLGHFISILSILFSDPKPKYNSFAWDEKYPWPETND